MYYPPYLSLFEKKKISKTLGVSPETQAWLKEDFEKTLEEVVKEEKPVDTSLISANPEVFREIDYNRFLRRAEEFSQDKDLPYAVMHHQNLSTLLEVYAAYLAIAQKFNLQGEETSKAFEDIKNLPGFLTDSILFLRDPLDKGHKFDLLNASEDDVKSALDGRGNLILEHYPFIGGIDERNLLLLYERLNNYYTNGPFRARNVWMGYINIYTGLINLCLLETDHPPKRDDSTGFIKSEEKLAKVLNSEIKRVRKELRRYSILPDKAQEEYTILDLREIRDGLSDVQAALTYQFSSFLSEFNEKQDNGRALLEAVNENPFVRFFFEKTRYSIMHQLSLSTMHLQKIGEFLFAQHTFKEFDPTKYHRFVPVTEEDLRAYKLFYKHRTPNFKS